MANPDYTAQDVPTWAANLDSMNSLKAVGNIGNPILYLQLLNSLVFYHGLGSITFARSTGATYIDRYGILQTVGVGEPRFELKGFLMEGQSFNLIDRSEEFTDASWSEGGTGTRTPNTTVAPDGTTTADTLDDTTGGAVYTVNNAATVANDTAVHTVSIFMKEGTAVKPALQIRYSGGTPIEFNADLVWATHTVANGSVEFVGNGWYRVQISFANNASGNTTLSLKVFAADRSTAATGTVIVWGAQMEELPFASSYIKTVGSGSIERATETCFITIGGNIGLQADAGAILVDFDSLGQAGANQFLVKINNETNRQLRATAGGTASRLTWGATDLLGETLVAGVAYRLGVVHDGDGGIGAWSNGLNTENAAGVDVSDSLGNGIYIGNNSAGTDALWGHIRNLRIYNVALSDREMAVA